MKAGNMRNFSNTLYPKHTHRKKEGEKKHFQQVRLTITSLPADDCQAGIWSHVSLILTKKKKPRTHVIWGDIYILHSQDVPAC